MANSKQKGNSFERTIAKLFSDHFNDTFKRVPQSGAITGGQNREKTKDLRQDAIEIFSGDIIVPDWFKFSIECKAYKDEPHFHQILNGESKVLDEWIRQADEDAKHSKKLPLIIFKINHKGTYAAFDVFLQDMVYDGEPFMVYRHKAITSLETFLNALGETYYKPKQIKLLAEK